MNPQTVTQRKDFFLSQKFILTLFGGFVVILLCLLVLGYLMVRFESAMEIIFRNIRYSILFGNAFLLPWTNPFEVGIFS